MQYSEKNYDIFISYAHEDFDWVYGNIFLPLSGCVKKSDGQPPVIFFDKDRQHGIKSGENFVAKIAKALFSSKQFIFAISPTYPNKKYCRYEYRNALTLDIDSEMGMLHPVLTSDDAKMPIEMGAIHYCHVSLPDWFDSLCDSLDLNKTDTPKQLSFITKPQKTFVDNTLAVVKVGLVDDKGNKIAEDGEIWLDNSDDILSGTLNAKIIDGVAKFDDIAFKKSGKHKLKAYSSLAETVESQEYDVVGEDCKYFENKSAVSWDNLSGRIEFFETSNAAIIINDNEITYITKDGTRKRIDADNFALRKLKNIVKKQKDMVIMMWDGRIIWCKDNGEYTLVDIAEKISSTKGCVPAGGWFKDEKLIAGLWNGRGITVGFDGSASTILKVESGIYKVIEFGNFILISDMEKGLHLYRQSQYLDTVKIEDTIIEMKSFDEYALVIGKNKNYYIKKGPLSVIDIDSNIKDGTYDCMAEDERLIIVSKSGLGILYDSQLNVKSRFRLPPGTKASYISKNGILGFTAPDNTDYVVATKNLPAGRVIYSNKNGRFTISPNGEYALANRQGNMILVDDTEIQTLLTRGEES